MPPKQVAKGKAKKRCAALAGPTSANSASLPHCSPLAPRAHANPATPHCNREEEEEEDEVPVKKSGKKSKAQESEEECVRNNALRRCGTPRQMQHPLTPPRPLTSLTPHLLQGGGGGGRGGGGR